MNRFDGGVENNIFLMKIENVEADITFEEHLVLPEPMEYDAMWKAALSIAFEFADTGPFLLRGLTYLGMGINGQAGISSDKVY